LVTNLILSFRSAPVVTRTFRVD